MSNHKKDPAQEQFQLIGLLAFAVLCLAGAFWHKHGYQVIELWHLYKVRLLILTIALGITGLFFLGFKLWDLYVDWSVQRIITAQKDRAVFLGSDEKGKSIYLHEEFRTGHAQVIGTTNAGKTESTILPWVIQDIENGSGLIIIDGKSDRSFLDKLYAYTAKANRTKDFRLFSLALPEHSSSINPLVGGSPQEVTERVFSSFEFENEHYRNVQFKIFFSIVTLIRERGGIPTFRLVHRLLTDMDELKDWLNDCEDLLLKRQLTLYQQEDPKIRAGNISGLDAKLSHFSMGELAGLFNSEDPQIDLGLALRENLICYFQLPTMYFGELSRATGKLVLQSFQSAVAKRHLGLEDRPSFFCCYLDDFQDYIFEGFASLLNKSRSANVGVVFSHQAMGDLRKVSPAFADIVTTNTNIKVVMRSNDPETCDYLAKTFGTKTSEKTTERRVKGVLGERNTGEGSVRETEEYVFHPNKIRHLERGQGVIAIPHPLGVKMGLIRFKRRPDISPRPLPRIPSSLPERPKEAKKSNSRTMGVLTSEQKTNEGAQDDE